MSKRASLLGAALLALVSVLSHAQAPVPLINVPLVPDATVPGGPQFTLTVNGTGFVSNSVVNWNGGGRVTTFVSGSRLTATILASDIAKPGTGQVTVVNPAPGGGTSNAISFEVTRPIPQFGFNSSDYALAGFNSCVLVADFNGDGNLDIAVAAYEGSSVSIYLGNGHGQFQHHGDYSTGTSTLDEMVAGDFNGDGKLDLVFADHSLLLGNGDGSFQAPILLAVPDSSDVAAGDFNGDGKLDLAFYDGLGTVRVLLGNGDGTFQAPVPYAVGSGYGMVTGDFNGDGKLDLAVLETGADDAVGILLGNGDGTFQPAVNYSTGGEGLWELYTADLNGDGALDLIVPISNGVEVLLGNGDGTFGSPVEYSVSAAYGRGGVADVNGDGKPDIVLTSGWDGGGEVFVLLGKGDGTFEAPRTYTGIGDWPFGTAFGDFNKDGILDMVFADFLVQSYFTVSLGTVVELQPETLSFGTVSVGQQASLSVTLTNIRKSTLQIARIVIPGEKSAFSQTNTCGSSVGAGQSCTITVTFAPTAPGPYSASVDVGDEAPGSPQLIFLSGTAPTP